MRGAEINRDYVRSALMTEDGQGAGVKGAILEAVLYVLDETERERLQMESRCNEYRDTVEEQAQRIAVLEQACEDYQGRILDLERVLTAEQRSVIECPCGGGAGHGPDWCEEFR